MNEAKIESRAYPLTHRVKRYCPTTQGLEPLSNDETAVLYEKWRANPCIEVKAENIAKQASLSFRQTAHSGHPTKVYKVNDTFLTRKMFDKKTYYTELQDKLV